ncbi:MAG: bifunctional pantoate--beta-alanine ligase/(d)CMP kinase, partial [Leptodesmis sp.]|uniref:bifunctional pantoate--beta-alanine ligase/(d)CMP kinase n=1 Tax=Leptodesmis sp. TaxID=3100501 RepID=UPI003D1243A9
LELNRFSPPRLEGIAVDENPPLLLPLDVGLVPTMGALHNGHLSLIRRARRENKILVVSIFVNPLQFGPNEDFQRYPRTLEQDRVLCESAGVDALFVPDAVEMGVAERRYGGNGGTGEGRGDGESHSNPPTLHPIPVTQVLPPTGIISGLCGRTRVGHFQGVATIVTKLLHIVQPQRAYFGQKDAQQLAVIRKMVADLNLPVEIVGCPIVREASGLAMSSRNRYLTAEEQQQAASVYQGLKNADRLFQSGERLSSTLIEAVKEVLKTVPAIAPEYIELVHPMTMEPLTQVQNAGLLAVAARLGSTRLIDNILLINRKPIVAIDGPAGAGKSTVARRVAATLGLFYLDTGAMYRALTWLVLQSGIRTEDQPEIAELVSRCEIEFREQGSEIGDRESGIGDPVKTQNSKFKIQNSPSIWINGQEVTQAIRSLEVTSQVSAIAAQPAVREALVRQQQRYGQQGGIVVEGRDIGTYVFPDAELKIFLTASVQERARRRQKDLQTQGIADISLGELEQAIQERDRKDSTRALAPLRKADDAIELNTDGLTVEQVVDKIVDLYRSAICNI